MRRAQVVVYVHLVWATWDRLPLLTGDVKRVAYRVIGAACQDMEAEVVALGGVEDHVHLLVQLPATVSVAELVKQIKGSSGHLLASQASESNGFFKWQGAYGAFSVSPYQVAAVCDYVARQEDITGSAHWWRNGRTVARAAWLAVETTPEGVPPQDLPAQVSSTATVLPVGARHAGRGKSRPNARTPSLVPRQVTVAVRGNPRRRVLWPQGLKARIHSSATRATGGARGLPSPIEKGTGG